MKRILIKETANLTSETVTVMGWVDTKRDHSKVIFIDLRDRTGKVQCVGFGEMSQMRELTVESVVEITGLVKAREEKNINQDILTGSIEIEVTAYKILNKSKDLPITLDTNGKEIGEEPRLEHRYLDLRRARMQKNLRLRSRFIQSLREALYEREFVDIETPMLTQSTKEGARDFIVPSRFQPGKFYALPQSPQQYKQLLMTAGFERYFQFARCIRDEDLRADRGFEFTQLDLEMSFVEREEVMKTVEDVTKLAVKAVGGKLKDEKFPVFTHQQAMEQFGADKFDLRTDEEKQQGVLSFAWVVDFPFFKKVDQEDAAEVADGKSGWTFTHNPFSAPQKEFVQDHLEGKNLGKILTTQYDLVCNGYEAGGGSIRAHDSAVLKATFKNMGYSDEEIEASVGHMLRAFEVGTPPHGGIALGIDRLVMILTGETSLKESIAFPMTSTGRTAVMSAPSEVEPGLLDELGLRVGGEESPHDAILRKLQQHGVSYEYIKHEPVFTSQEAAKIRSQDSLSMNAKALILQADNSDYILAVVPGDKKLNLEALRKYLGVKRLAMASKKSVLSETGLEVGSIPPFGSVMKIKTYLDQDLAKNEKIAFNVGRHDRSVMMSYEDYLKVENPEVVSLD